MISALSDTQEPQSLFQGLTYSLSLNTPAWAGVRLKPSFCQLWQLFPLQGTPPLRMESAVCSFPSYPNHEAEPQGDFLQRLVWEGQGQSCHSRVIDASGFSSNLDLRGDIRQITQSLGLFKKTSRSQGFLPSLDGEGLVA